MSLSTRSRPRRAAIVAALVTAGSACLVALGVGPAQADPAADCATAFPVADLIDGQPVSGVTVSKGTIPEPFTGEVLGVLDDGIGVGLDMIIMDLTSPAIDRVGGIWAGMSGSPVYAADGRLIGAVAYGLAWGTTPIAGVTPFEEMDDLRDPPPVTPRVRVSTADARVVARSGDVTVSQAQQGFKHLPVPTGISGISAARVDQSTGRAYLAKPQYRTGRATAVTEATVDTLTAGGNLASVESIGDITFAGVGTVTSVCDGRLVGFGHPMSFSGEASSGLGAASAVYVQEDPLGVPFKVANIGEIGGTITDDRMAGIAGVLGAPPVAAPFTSDITFGPRARVGETDVLVPAAYPSVAFYGALGNHDRVLDAIMAGSETQAWRITGTQGDGTPFTIRYDDRYRSSFDIAFEAGYPLADVIHALSNVEGVEITSVSSTATVSKDAASYRLRKIEQNRGSGRWVNVTRRTAVARAGHTLRLRLTLVSDQGAIRRMLRIDIPRRLAGRAGGIELIGGNRHEIPIWRLKSFDAIAQALRTQPRNDEVLAQVSIGRGSRSLRRSLLTPPADHVVDGFRGVGVIVR